MEIKPIYIILVDISGYTRFIQQHKMALLHAESIIGALMEAMLDQVEAPIVAHEILGDAVTFYAVDDGRPNMAKEIYDQVLGYFSAFWSCEKGLVSECTVCTCAACRAIGQLKLKAILHFGEAAFTKVRDIQKISGSDVITAHRLLKNGVASSQYLLLTQAFNDKMGDLSDEFQKRKEKTEGIGTVTVYVKNLEQDVVADIEKSVFSKIVRHLKTNIGAYSRMLGLKQRATFRNFK